MSIYFLTRPNDSILYKYLKEITLSSTRVGNTGFKILSITLIGMICCNFMHCSIQSFDNWVLLNFLFVSSS